MNNEEIERVLRDITLEKYAFLAGQNSQKEKDLKEELKFIKNIKSNFENLSLNDIAGIILSRERELTQKINGKEKENVEM